MENSAFQSADGEMLIVAQEGNLNIKTEFGLLKGEFSNWPVLISKIKFLIEKLFQLFLVKYVLFLRESDSLLKLKETVIAI